MHQRRIAEAFASHVGHSVVLVVEVRDDLAETPKQYRLRLSKSGWHSQKTSYEDPFVSALTSVLMRQCASSLLSQEMEAPMFRDRFRR